MQSLQPFPRPGDEVVVRRQRWRVQATRVYDDCLVVSLAGTEASNLGIERQHLSPFERIDPAARRPRLRLVRAARWRRACRAALAATAPPGALRAAGGAAIALLPHQLEPALAVIAGKGTRLLLADAVGLGKTIEAGLVIAELRAREAADRVLVVAPPGVCDQWRDELARRFHIEATVVDAADVRRRAAELPPAVSPWSTVATAIASLDYVKRPETRPAVLDRCWDVLVVDEAHLLGASTDRRAVVEDLAGRAAYVLLLSATPHDGNRDRFLSLCRIGSHGDPLLIFRRTREEIRGGARRRVHRLHVRPTPAEESMHRALARFGAAVRAERGDASREIWLALAVLHKRALSSARSLELSVERRLASLDRIDDGVQPQLVLPLDAAAELDEADAAPPWPQPLALRDRGHERRLLEALRTVARSAARRESKIGALTRLLSRLREPVIVFTEYRDTLAHLAERLAGSFVMVHGGMSRRERQAALRDFEAGRRRWLLATDAAGQGLNLQCGCRSVVNLELPWNPMRLEQRIGRVDRIGQRRTVHAFHFIARGTTEESVLNRLRQRLAAAREDIGTLDPLGDDDADVARQVLAGFPDSRRPSDATGNAALRRSFDLSVEARRETERIAALRRLEGEAERRLLLVLEADAPWLAWSGSRRSRERLAWRVMVLLRCTLEDASGRPVDRMFAAAAIHGASAARLSRLDVDSLWQSCQAEVASRVVDAIREWRADATRVALSFATARLARARAGLAQLERPAGLFQPGLFERRAAVEREAVESAVNAARSDIAQRIADAVVRTELRIRGPELWLAIAR